MDIFSRTSVFLLGFLLLFGFAGAYTTYIHAPAVFLNQDVGTLTDISLNITAGNGTVSITGPAVVGNSTLISAETAVAYATSRLGIDENNSNYIYHITDHQAVTSDVSGPSAGLALTLLAVYNLQGKSLPNDFTVTGTISPDGTVGQIGGVYDKIGAAKNRGMSYVLVPYAQNGSFENELYYISQQTFNIPVIEVANVTQALGFLNGSRNLSPVGYNTSVDYKVSGLPYGNPECATCNISAFTRLETFTFNYTKDRIAQIGENFSALKGQMQTQLQQYEKIGARGYLYSASDLAFLEYIDAFIMVHSNGITPQSASSVVQNVSSYCNSLVPPSMTDTNYEYVVGGELRQTWGTIYASEANSSLNASETSDQLISSMSFAGSADAWCKAAGEMYAIASSMGGSYVSTNPTLKNTAAMLINNISEYGQNNFYVESALKNYKEGNYAAALYNSAYVYSFIAPLPSIQNITSGNPILGNLSTYNNGIWPSEFVLQSQFYEYEAQQNRGNTSMFNSYMTQAYETGLLASYLDKYNGEISSSFQYNTTGTTVTQANYTQLITKINKLQEEMYGVYALLLIAIVILVIIIAIVSASAFLKGKTYVSSNTTVRRRRRRR